MKDFFKKINLCVTDANYLATQALNATTKSALGFFFLLFLISMLISAGTRTAKIVKSAPDILVSSVGILEFENYNLITPDTLKQINGRKIIALISGKNISQTANNPIDITAGIDSIKTSQKPFIHIGKTGFSTNIFSIISQNNASVIQNIPWTKTLPSPNLIADANFYKKQFSNISTKTQLFIGALIIISVDMISAILQIWIAILIYLLFFGRTLKFAGRLRMLMFATIPYFIVMPISILATNGFAWTTDIALIGGLIMTFRAVTRLDLKEAANEKN